MEKDRKIKMLSRKINWSNLHANPKIIRTAIFRGFHGFASEFIKSFSR